MKSVLICFLFPVFSLFNSSFSARNEAPYTLINGKEAQVCRVKKILYFFKPKECIVSLLNDVVRSNKKYYNGNREFYSLTFEKSHSETYIRIETQPWDSPRFNDYSGIIQLGETRILCRGSFVNQTLFEKQTLFREIEFCSKSDSLVQPIFSRDPSLQGEYQSCEGEPIHVEVYVKTKIQGYEMETRKVGH